MFNTKFKPFGQLKAISWINEVSQDLSLRAISEGYPIWQQGKSERFDRCDRPSNLKLDPNCQFFSPCDLDILWMTSKNNKALLLYYIKLWTSFQIHRWIQTGVTVWKRSIRVEIADILSRVALEFDGWPWKKIGHVFYTTSSFVLHFKSISKVKPELQSGNTKKLVIFFIDDFEKQ